MAEEIMQHSQRQEVSTLTQLLDFYTFVVCTYPFPNLSHKFIASIIDYENPKVRQISPMGNVTTLPIMYRTRYSPAKSMTIFNNIDKIQISFHNSVWTYW